MELQEVHLLLPHAIASHAQALSTQTNDTTFEVLPNGTGLKMLEIAEGETLESVRASTGCDFAVADDPKPMRQA